MPFLFVLAGWTHILSSFVTSGLVVRSDGTTHLYESIGWTGGSGDGGRCDGQRGQYYRNKHDGGQMGWMRGCSGVGWSERGCRWDDA